MTDMSQKSIEKKIEIKGSNVDGDTYTVTTSVAEVSNQGSEKNITIELE